MLALVQLSLSLATLGSVLAWHSYVPWSLARRGPICKVQSGESGECRRERRGEEEKRVVPDERTVRWEEAREGPASLTQDSEAEPRSVT